MFHRARLAQTFEDDGFQIPIGSWSRQVVNWLDTSLKGLFNAIAWPFDQAMALMENGDDEFIVVPRLVVLLLLGIAAYIGGGYRRIAYVIGAAGFLALLGNTTWRDSMLTLYALLVVIAAMAILATVINALVRLIVANRYPGALRYYRRVLLGWSWLHPYGLMLPAVFFFGIGQTVSLVLATFMVLPIALTASAHDPTPTGIRQGLRASVFPTTLLLGFFAFIGMNGLGQPLLRGLSNQDVAVGSQAMVALWLTGFVVWCLLGPWNLDHLPGRKNASASIDQASTKAESITAA